MQACRVVVFAALALALAACVPTPEKPEEIPSKDTFECTIEGERWLVRFVDNEARLLTPQGERINLYPIATASGVRYSNGLVEMRGRGMELTLIRDNFARQMIGCKPVMVPKEPPPGPLMRIWEKPSGPPLGP